MTAPDRTTWTVAEDGDGDLTLWHGATAVLRKYELGPPWRGGSEAYPDRLWQVLTRVLAPDEATIERLARALVKQRRQLNGWESCPEPTRDRYRRDAEAVLAALADTSAQARPTDDDTGGGEHG